MNQNEVIDLAYKYLNRYDIIMKVMFILDQVFWEGKG